MLDFLPKEKRKILLKYPFVREFLREKVNKSNFLSNLTSFKKELLKKGITENDIKMIISQIKVAVIIPMYNEEDYIYRTVESFINQDLPKQEYCIVVVNNNSTDKSMQVVKSIIANNSSTKIYLINESKKGCGNARKTGSDYAIQIGVRYIVHVDSGARYKSNFLSKIVSKFEKNPKIGVIYAKEDYDGLDMKESVGRLFRFHGWDIKYFKKIINDSYSFIKQQWDLGRNYGYKRISYYKQMNYPVEKIMYKGDRGDKIIEKCRGAGTAYRIQAYKDGKGFDPSDSTAEDLRLARRIYDTKKWKTSGCIGLHFYESVRRYLPPVNKMINYNGLNCIFIDFGAGYRKQGAGEKHDRIRQSGKKPRKISIEEFLQNRKYVIKYCQTLVRYMFFDQVPDKIKEQDWFKKVFYQSVDVKGLETPK